MMDILTTFDRTSISGLDNYTTKNLVSNVLIENVEQPIDV